MLEAGRMFWGRNGVHFAWLAHATKRHRLARAAFTSKELRGDAQHDWYARLTMNVIFPCFGTNSSQLVRLCSLCVTCVHSGGKRVYPAILAADTRGPHLPVGRYVTASGPGSFDQ